MSGNGDKPTPVDLALDPPIEVNCLMCAYHDKIPVATPDNKPVIGQEQTICRRYPPSPVFMQIPTPNGVVNTILPQYPPVNESTWCHEFEAENGAQDVT